MKNELLLPEDILTDDQARSFFCMLSRLLDKKKEIAIYLGMEKNGENKKRNDPKHQLYYVSFLCLVVLLLFGMIRIRKEWKIREENFLMHLWTEQETANEKAETGRSVAEREKTIQESHSEDAEKTKTQVQAQMKMEETTIRIVLSVDGTEKYMHQDVCVSCTGDYKIDGDVTAFEDADSSIKLSELLEIGQKVRIKAVDGVTPVTLESVTRAQGKPAYGGMLEIRREAEGFLIVNQIDLEEYLKGVVPGEMPADAPIQALCAQAVCARTYAVRQMRDSRMEQWEADVDDTVSCQVYNNISRQPSSDQAVDDTKGLIVCCDGEPIEAYFFSTSWGYTDTDRVWNSTVNTSYLKSISVSRESVEAVQHGKTESRIQKETMSEENFREKIRNISADDYEKDDIWYRWRVEIPWQRVKQNSETGWPQIGEFAGMKILERNPGGGVKQLEVKGSVENVVLENEYMIRKLLSVKGLPVIRNDGSICTTMELLPSACFMIEEEKDHKGTLFLLYGGGYGHGVGMSQNGARHLAENGWKWREILQLFYQDIQIENLQES